MKKQTKIIIWIIALIIILLFLNSFGIFHFNNPESVVSSSNGVLGYPGQGGISP